MRYTGNARWLALLLASIACSAHAEVMSFTYRVHWGPLTLATISDQLEYTPQDYTATSELSPASWLAIFALPGLRRTVQGEITSAGKLRPTNYTQRYKERQSTIQFDHATDTIRWNDSQRGDGQEPMVHAGVYAAVDSLSAMYMFAFLADPPPPYLLVQFANGWRVREYELDGEFDSTISEALDATFTTARYEGLTSRIAIWYAQELNWLPVKAQFGEGLWALQLELIAIGS